MSDAGSRIQCPHVRCRWSPDRFVQDNRPFSQRCVLRGLHYQLLQPQGKLVAVISGHIWDVAVDLRPNSPDFGRWAGFHLYGEDMEFLWIPQGFAHGFVVLSETANVLARPPILLPGWITLGSLG